MRNPSTTYGSTTDAYDDTLAVTSLCALRGAWDSVHTLHHRYILQPLGLTVKAPLTGVGFLDFGVLNRGSTVPEYGRGPA